MKYWQLGNETSYDKRGFDLETAARKTIEFARPCATSTRRSSLSPGAIPAGPRACPKKRATRSTCWPSITCSIPIDEKPSAAGELYRRDADATWRG